jgi:hypothetical protein
MRKRALFVVVAAAWCVPAARAGMPAVRVSGVRPLSAPTPRWQDACGPPLFTTEGTGFNPSIVVDPRHPLHIIAAWRVFVHGHERLLTAVSHDGGKTFKRSPIPGLSDCPAGAKPIIGDYGIAIGPDRGVFVNALSFASLQPHGRSPVQATGVAATGSLNGGATWTNPSVLIPDGRQLNDRAGVGADPRHPGRGYAVWDHHTGQMDQTGTLELSITRNYGRTWSARRAIYTAQRPDMSQSGPGVDAFPDGTLAITFDDIPSVNYAPGPNHPLLPFTTRTIRSRDGGRTWSRPVKIGTHAARFPTDPDTGGDLPYTPLTTTAVAPDGTYYAAWPSSRSPTDSELDITRSTNHGRTWTKPHPIAHFSWQAFVPKLAVSCDGTVGIMFYDFRHDHPGDSPLTTDLWIATSRDHGQTWRQTRIAGPFDLRTAHTVNSALGTGYQLGIVQGLAGTPDGFVAAYTVSGPLATTGQDEVFFARLHLTRPRVTRRSCVEPRPGHAAKSRRASGRRGTGATRPF